MAAGGAPPQIQNILLSIFLDPLLSAPPDHFSSLHLVGGEKHQQIGNHDAYKLQAVSGETISRVRGSVRHRDLIDAVVPR